MTIKTILRPFPRRLRVRRVPRRARALHGAKPAAARPHQSCAPERLFQPARPAPTIRASASSPASYDAGEAIFGLQKVGQPAEAARVRARSQRARASSAARSARRRAAGGRGRGPTINTGSVNSDLAFSGNHLFVGNYNGINFYDIDNPAKIKLGTSLVCPGGQGDVSVYGHLLFMSAEAMNGRIDCGTQGIPCPPATSAPPPPPAAARRCRSARRARRARAADAVPPPPSPDRFRGVRIFDISDLANPKQVAAVQSCRGSHTHSLLVDPKDKDNVYIYISGTGPVRQAEELAGCSGGDPEGQSRRPRSSASTSSRCPLAHPGAGQDRLQPAHLHRHADRRHRTACGRAARTAKARRRTSTTNQCHDITIYSAVGLAAGACSGNGILLDISDPINPKRIDAVSDPNYAYWHSANFSNDGSKVLFTDEWGGGAQPRCRATDPMHWGADAIFTLSNRKLTLSSYYKMPAPQTEFENCVAHNGSLVPIPGRDIFVQAWYQGGISMVDFTDAAHPLRSPTSTAARSTRVKRGTGGFWSVYWYNGYIYGSEIARGVDVFRLVPSKFLTQNEIDASNQVHFDELNVQNQPKIVWPQNLIVGKAYVAQLERSGALAAPRIASLKAAIAKVEKPGVEPQRFGGSQVHRRDSR